jgi:hypothetical protein
LPPPLAAHSSLLSIAHTHALEQEGKSKLVGALVAGTAVAGGVAVCSADHVPSIDYGWSHHGLLASYDYAA